MSKIFPAMAFFSLILVMRPSLASDTPSVPSTDEVLKILTEGNIRFVSGKSLHSRQDSTRRVETVANGQHPLVSILGCSDSRVPLEAIFDQGIGDIFNVRVAGNVADIDEIGSLEYGAGHLGTPLIVVLGHSKCGAVTAVVKKDKVGENIAKLVDNIVPAVAKAQQKNPSADVNVQISEAITANVWQSIEDIIKHSPEIYELLENGKVKIVGALYDLESGKVTWLGPHPELIKIMVAVKVEEEKASKPARKTTDRATAPQPENTHGATGTSVAERSGGFKSKKDFGIAKHE